MLYFLQPIWLWLTAGIVVPVLIHLWNIRQGKTLKVGSIAFIEESVQSQARNFKITQWLLLLLRCLLIVVLAMLIAKPYIQKQLSKEETGWILIKKEDVKTACRAYPALIDSLKKKGFALHCFDKGFEKIEWKDTSETIKNTTIKQRLSYWTLLKMLNQQLPATMPVCLFTDNLLQHFSGSRPEIALHPKWYIFPATDTATWLAHAYATATDSLRIISGKSNASATYYTSQNIAADNSDEHFKITGKNGKINIVSSNAAQQMITADTATLTLVVYANKYVADAAYLKAALNAVKDVTRRKMKIITAKTTANIPHTFSWLFWLSEENIPASLIKNNVLLYENGNIKNTHSTLLVNSGAALTTAESVALYQYIPGSNGAYLPVWTNGFAEPVLSMEKTNANIYHFYSHFNPQWSDLVWSHSFPQVVYNLLLGSNPQEDAIDIINDKRSIDAAQIQPAFSSFTPYNSSAALNNTTDVSYLIWLIAFSLFIVERIIASRQIKQNV